MPNHVGGPIEIRQLPPAKQLSTDYEEWLTVDPSPKVRLYEVVVGSTNAQLAFEMQHVSGKAPSLGTRTSTFASFILVNSVNGQYRLVWNSPRKESAGFLRISGQPKKMLLHVIDPSSAERIPTLDILAVEGTKPFTMLVATEGKKLPHQPVKTQ